MTSSKETSRYEAFLQGFSKDRTGRCTATTLQNKRCKNKTNLSYRNECTTHGIKETSLKIQPSLIKNAGNGLFATKGFDEGDAIGVYTGKVLNWNTYNKLANKDYCLEVPKDAIPWSTQRLVIDGSDEEMSSICRWVNDPRDSTKYNVKIKWFQRRDSESMVPVFITSEAIEAGSEIYVDYGKHYWN